MLWMSEGSGWPVHTYTVSSLTLSEARAVHYINRGGDTQ